MDFGDIIYIIILIGGILFSFVGKAMKKTVEADDVLPQSEPEPAEMYAPQPMEMPRRNVKTRKPKTVPPVPTSTIGMAQIEVQAQPYSEISASEIGSETEEVDNSFTLSDEEIRKGIIIRELLDRKF